MIDLTKMQLISKALVIFAIFQIRGCSANLSPVFTLDMNNLAISEKTPVGTVIYRLEGFDPENSSLHFDLKGTDVLQVNPESGEVTVVKPLDYETNDTLNVIVSIEDEVRDGGGSRNNIVEVPVTVIILDENDNAPDFLNAPYQISVDENTPLGSVILWNLTVVDKDSTGQNVEVDCISIPGYEEACDVFRIKALHSAQNSYTGMIILNDTLDYALEQEYQFLLKASDGDLSSTAKVIIKVGDIQNTPPYFIGEFKANISEDAPINTLIMKIKAQDGDRGKPRTVVYELLNNPQNYFLLDAVTGELVTAKPLDKEAIDNPDGKITLTIRARELVDGQKGIDSLTTTETEAEITVTDVNDEPPTFNKREYHVEIPENIAEGVALPGLDMAAADPDEGANSVFTLSLNDISGVFKIEPEEAVGSTKIKIIVANSSLDYENPNQRKFIILAIAREKHSEEKLSSTATITVTVTDVNDNAPTFDQQTYSATISELAAPSTLVTTITAKDRDNGKFGENGIIYRLSGNGAEKFNVNNRTGTVTVAECDIVGQEMCLDFETKPEYLLLFVATDDDGTGQTTMVPLKISLTDTNDNPPVFNQPFYRAFINEGADKFEPDLIIEANDADKTSHVSYSIISGNNEGLFSIDPNTGKIRIASNKGLNVDGNMDDVVVLTVMASDGKFTSTAEVNITIKDVNNNAPVFLKENYVESVLEDFDVGTNITTVEATDADSGLNAQIEYFIYKGGYDDFSIENDTGVVILNTKLDYDRRNTYNIEIVAKDYGEPSLSGTTTLTVNVVNTNNKLPYFIPATQKAEVMEDAPIDTIVHVLSALDPDLNSSEALNFAATEPITALDKHGNQVLNREDFKDFFTVDTNTGTVSVINSLQRDVAAVIRIPVLVTDITAQTVQQGQGLLEITIGDVNDSPPSFLPPWTVENPIYYLELKEEQPVGTIVATYKAFDDDSDIASYAIIPEDEYFQINHGTGIVQIKKLIDYEKIQSHIFMIYAFDSGVPQLNVTAEIHVAVLNLNDNDPIFSEKQYNASVSENSPNGTVIVVVQATDLDYGGYGIVSYSLTGEFSKNFHMDNDSGEISIANSNFLDYEIINETVLEAVASDNAPGNLKRSVAVPIYLEITDLNDNAPKFNQSEYKITIMENVRLNPPMPLLQVNATDADSGLNGHIQYSITKGNTNDVFLIGIETGILYPHKVLYGQPREFRLRIEARDGAENRPLYDTAYVNIQVLNVNNHKPVFIMPSLPNATIEITENTAVKGYLVMTIKAKDDDDGENSRITYHLKKGDENVQETNEFIINPTLGELKAKITLDRELQSQYELILVARDHGTPIWFETVCHLTVLIVDTNDNRPEFPDYLMESPYHFDVTENAEKGLRIGEVRALDKDEGNHAKVYYYLIMETEKGAFYLDKSDGSLYTNKSFDREEKDEYNLFILANNNPDFYLTKEEQKKITRDDIRYDNSIAKVKVTINDLNDNAPFFDQAVYYAAVNTMANVNDIVVRVSASDPDAGPNGSLTYYVKASNLYKYGSSKSSGSIIPSPFNISQKGEVSTATFLAENNQHKFVLDLIAREDASPAREAYSKVYLWIFEPHQLIRIILSRPTEEVKRQQIDIVTELSNATKSLVIVDDIRYHTDDSGNKNEEWSDMYILVIDLTTQTIQSVPHVLRIIDSKYDFLKDYYSGFAIENVMPALLLDKDDSFDPALTALIALLIVLFVGIITFTVICCCLRHWVISPSDLKKKDTLIKKAIIDDLNTTENPLWIEQRLKIYEEQELTMQVFSEPEQNALARRSSDDYIPDDNTYATIQHPNRRGSSHLATMSLGDELADYATLSGVPNPPDSAHSSLRGAPNYYETSLGFQGSTFQVPDRPLTDASSFEGYNGRARFKGSELTINHDNQPEYVAELI